MYSQPWRTILSNQLSLVPNGAMANQTESGDASDDWMEAHGMMRTNSAADLDNFLNALVTNALIMAAAILFFCIMRPLIPQVFSWNARKKEEGGRDTAPFVPSNTFFGWVSAGLGVSLEEASKTSGLDAALVLEFTELSRNILVTIGLPLVFIMCPLHFFLGGDRALRSGDKLSALGLNNVETGSWLFWVHALMVWYVVMATEELIFDSMARFLAHRFKWLLDFRPPQALTILVEHIPAAYRSDRALKELFSSLFPNSVESAYLVKNTSKLKPIVEKLKAKNLQLEILVYRRDHKSTSRSTTPLPSPRRSGLEPKDMKELKELRIEAQELRIQANDERRRVLKEADAGYEVSPPNSGRYSTAEAIISHAVRPIATSSGFVTFSSQREALIALHTRCTADMDEFVMSIPPQPNDIIYEDLQVPKFQQRVWSFLGWAMIVLLFWGFLPLVMIIASFTNLEAMKEHSDFVKEFVDKYPACRAMLDGVLSTLALVLVMGFLPTLLMMIFNNFFTLKAYAWAQLKLQRYYFWFLVTFVLLVTAVGNSILSRVVSIYDHPASVFYMLSDALPTATNFYLNFMLVQTMQHAVNLTRYVQVAKYWSFRALLGADRAVDLSEPEDQDYYGIGARSARLALDLVIGLVFCSLCPLITVVCLANFLLCRLTYGYLVVFSETRKSDLGGPFFVQQLWQVQFGLLMYAIVMCSIMMRRAGHWGPLLITGATIPYIFYCKWRFNHAFLWQNLPMIDICTEENRSESEDKMRAYRASSEGKPAYMQPELVEEPGSPSSPSSSPASQKEAEALGQS
mmetsp:Transcript_11298/g.30791  ORF Transcript_11298/g.30791 Transcript_11298/m.30791 type:complete len:800 (-) Transcript_11298:120-2519(-)